MKNSKIQKKWNAPIICFIVFFVVILILFLQFCYLSLSKEVYGINMKQFASDRNTVTSVLTADRGTIYDVEGNVLAQNISSYTLIAYLDPTRTIDDNDPHHVVDKDYTATKLSSILGSENYDYILTRLNSNAKQVEFGTIGRNLTELTKLAIEELDLPGISFTETLKRYYPNGNFASYIVGYAKQYTRINVKEDESYDLSKYYKNYFNNYNGITIEIGDDSIINIDGTIITALREGTSTLLIKTYGETLATIIVNVTEYNSYDEIDTTITGELGIESKFEKKLQGVDGYIEYQQDKYGYQIPNTPEKKVEAKDGYDIYLTIDSNIQRFAENAITEIINYEPKWAIVTVMDAKSGSILATATSPSYNPNSLPNNMSYQNPLVSYTYEPGSVMKTYTYMCAIETGMYDGTKSYLSGGYSFDDGTVIHDWNKNGWGYLNYDTGFVYSSNVGIINIIKDYLDLTKLKSCLESYGFGAKTGIELSNEEKGSTRIEYETELMAAGFGQGISTTPIQQLQALSIIANNGKMVSPHIINKMVNKQTNEELVTKVKKSKQIVSNSTISKMKDLMESVISSTSITASNYYMEGYNLIGKTGTAQIYENGGYLEGSTNVISSIALMYPKDDPQIIIYAAMKQPNSSYTRILSNPIKEMIQNISKYKRLFSEEEISENFTYTLNTYISKNADEVKRELKNNNLDPVVLGDGKNIISQYPNKNTTLLKGDKVFLITNSDNMVMPNISSWSRFDIVKLCELLGINYNFDGYGYAVSQSIIPGTQITKGLKLDVLLGNLRE